MSGVGPAGSQFAICVFQKPLQGPPCSLTPGAFRALPFVPHALLSGLPHPILSLDPNPNSYLIFKIQLSLLCGMHA